ncbi:MAG: DNA polymerase IV [Chitinophagales bacterium]
MFLNSDRTIVHMDLDCFFVAVSRLMNPALNNKPVLIGGSSDRGVVAACSYEARKYGIHSAMPMKLAKRLCPEALVVHGDYEMYTKKSDEVTEIIKENVPVYEKSSVDEFYIDLSGMERFHNSENLAIKVWEKVKEETGLPSSFGLSVNKTVSKVATDYIKPNNKHVVHHGAEKGFLAPMSVNKIPGVGEKTYHTLRQMGIEKIYTLQQMPVESMQDILGQNGATIWRKANGIDDTPVIPYSERKSISSEETFDQDTIDIVKLKDILIRMTESLLFQLRNEKKLTSCVTVKIRYSNFDTHTIQRRIPYTSCDHHLIPLVKELFNKLYERRMLVRLAGVGFSYLVGGSYQINLFEDSLEQIQLYQAMDRLKNRYGDDAVMRAAGMGFHLRDFNPFNGIRKSVAGGVQKKEMAMA